MAEAVRPGTGGAPSGSAWGGFCWLPFGPVLGKRSRVSCRGRSAVARVEARTWGRARWCSVCVVHYCRWQPRGLQEEMKFSLHHSDRRCRPERREPPRWSTGPKTPLPVTKAATVDPGECRVSGSPVAGAAKHPPCTAAAAALCSPSECCGARVTAGTPDVVDGSQVPALRGSATGCPIRGALAREPQL